MSLAAASAEAIDIFVRANARVWEQIATDDPAPWKRHMAAVTHEWSAHRRGASRR